jgi:hypothetical protein
MTLRGRQVPLDTLMWFGLLAAPGAWVAQFVFGFGVTQAACGSGGSRWGIPVDGWTAIATGLAAAIAVAGGVAAVAAFRATREAEGTGGADEPPPVGRIHFLATVGMAITPLFLFIILMSGLGVVALPNCQQS